MSSDEPVVPGISEPSDAAHVSTDNPLVRRRSWRLGRRTAVVTAVALAVAAGGGAIAAAAGGHGGGVTGGHGGEAGPQGGAMPGGARPGPDDPLMHSLHGTFVVPSADGGTASYVTDVQQTGTVTALSATSISLRSVDGYTATYVIDSSTKKDSSVANGATATVIATGDPATALAIRDHAQRGRAGPGGPPGRGGEQPPGEGGNPT